MNIQEAMGYISQTQWMGSRLGLSRMEELLNYMDNPQKKLKFIHIAGSNGKGSTASMLASVLIEAGYKTGLYTSPFIHCFNERMQINGEYISDEELIEIVERLRPYVDKMEDKPTEFEIITCIAFEYYHRHNCQLVVLEVGLGGRLDSTNIIDSPEVAVITAIGLEHTKELGNTIEKIAFEKAGIIKKGCDVVLYQQQPSVHQVVKQVAEKAGVTVYEADFAEIEVTKESLKGQVFNVGHTKNITITLLGEHQLRNAAVVLKTLEVLRKRGYSISDEALYEGFRKAKWLGRFELLQENPRFIVDGAHNPHGVRSLVAGISTYFPGEKITFVAGVLKDKNYKEMFDLIVPYAKRIIAVEPGIYRALSHHELKEFLQESYEVEVIEAGGINEGIKKALELSSDNEAICAFGSLYMVGAIREYFGLYR